MTFFSLVFAALAAAALPALASEDACRFGGADYWAAVAEDEVRACLQDGADPNVRNENGETALHLASAYGDDPLLIELLIDQGADLMLRQKDGLTPLHMAAKHANEPAVLAVLIFHGAEVHTMYDVDEGWFGTWGTTPLHSAAQNSNANISATLIAAQADVEQQNKNGQTALHLAAQHSPDERTVEILLVGGAEPNASDEKGWTPLHMAASYTGSLQIVKRLLQGGADASIIGGEEEMGQDQTALRLAARFTARPDIFDELIDATDDPCAEDSKGRDAVEIAKKNEALANTPPFWRLHEICFK